MNADNLSTRVSVFLLVEKLRQKNFLKDKEKRKKKNPPTITGLIDCIPRIEWSALNFMSSFSETQRLREWKFDYPKI